MKGRAELLGTLRIDVSVPKSLLQEEKSCRHLDLIYGRTNARTTYARTTSRHHVWSVRQTLVRSFWLNGTIGKDTLQSHRCERDQIGITSLKKELPVSVAYTVIARHRVSAPCLVRPVMGYITPLLRTYVPVSTFYNQSTITTLFGTPKPYVYVYDLPNTDQ